MQGMGREQQALRRELGRLMLQMDEILGSIPGGLGEAERAMKQAGDALQQGNAQGAVPKQSEALERLRQGLNQAAEQMARRMQGQGRMGFSPGPDGQRMGNGQDPFGRNSGGAMGGIESGSDAKIPNQRDILRTRKIINELRRRAGELSRPQLEREYNDRLLRRF